jgi:hypothetical protein
VTSPEHGDEVAQDSLPTSWPPRQPREKRPRQDCRVGFWTCFRAACLTGPWVPYNLLAAWLALLQARKWWRAREIPEQILAYASADRRERARMAQPRWDQPPHS